MNTGLATLFAATAAPAVAPAGQSTLDATILDIMLRAGAAWVLWLLLGLSLIAVAIMIERAIFFLWEREPARALAEALAALRTEGPAAALARLEGKRSMSAAVARVCLAHTGDGAEAVSELVAATLKTERLRYERSLAFLGTLGANAPFVGLFGTVLGIVRSFHDLSLNTTEGSAAVMAGIAEALVATAVGLLVALPAVALFNWFGRHVESCVVAAEGNSHRILAHNKRVPAGDPPGTGPVEATASAVAGTEVR
jgi:biopolymer transport protein ExbB